LLGQGKTVSQACEQRHIAAQSGIGDGSRLYPAPGSGPNGPTPHPRWGWDSCGWFSRKTKRGPSVATTLRRSANARLANAPPVKHTQEGRSRDER
jgi:hypothetical protein